MSESSHKKSEKKIFMAAQELPPEAREGYLNDACGGDEALKRAVRELLAAGGDTDGMFDTERNDPTTLKAVDAPKERCDTRIGRYKLLEKLGEGGFGSVWAAEQREPVKRRVALKIIKLGMDTKQVVARFEAERQALALMDHPNIAKVLDAGSTDTGRPYFVMELVKGIPITKYAEQEKLNTEARLDLFIKVCQAIQHAHQKGVIHRDIKPSNIMVTLHDGVPVPKVIDFGIAKATQQELTEKTIYTQYSQFIGTPAYMSPEQAEMSGLDIDTRSDIYSLGVLLYELLTGTTPFDTQELMQSGLDEMRKIIREREPVRPSTRVSRTLSEKAERPASHVQRSTLPSDLDWIVMKCLEKDRSRRYETANELAADIKRHLNNEPVGARPPSAAYKFQKAWRRNKGVYTAGAAVAMALIVGFSVSFWQMQVAQRAKETADTRFLALTEAEQRLQSTLDTEKALKAQLESRTRNLEASEANLHNQLYYTDMNLAGHAMKESAGLVRVDRLTAKWLPKPGESAADDPRGWEWYYLRSQLLQDVRTIHYESLGQTWVVWGKDGCYQFEEADGELIITRIAVSPREKDLPVRRLRLGPAGTTLQGWKPSPDGTWLALATSDGSIEIWDWRKGKVHIRLDGSSEETKWLDWSQDARRLAAWGDDGNLRFWNITDREEYLKLRWDNDAPPLYAHWEPGGDRIGITAQLTFQLLDPLKETLLPPPVDDTRYWFWRGAWSPRGNRIALADLDGFQIRIYDAKTWEFPQFLDGNVGPALCLAWAPDGRYLAAGGSDHMVRIWDTKSNQSQPTHQFSGHIGGVWRIQWNLSGEYLISMSGSYVFKIWKLSEGKIEKTPYGSDLLAECVGQLFLGWSPDGTSFATTDGAQILIWNATTRQIKSRINGLERLLADQADEPGIAELEFKLKVAWSPHSDHVAVSLSGPELPKEMSYQGRTIHIFNSTSGERKQVIRGEILSGDRLAWSPGENIIAAAHGETVVLWDPETGEAVDSWSWEGSYITSLAWNPDGIRLAVASSAVHGSTNRQIKVWNTRTEEMAVMESAGHPDLTGNYQLNWDRDGRWLIACHGSTLRAFHMWDGATGELEQAFRGHAHGVDSIAWSSDGGRIVSGSKDSTVRVWDPESGRETLTLADFPSLPYIFWRPGEGHDKSFLTQMTYKPGYVQYLWDASQGYQEEERRLATIVPNPVR